MVNDGITIEAGDPLPAVRDFLMDDYTVERTTGWTEELNSMPGKHAITFTIEGEQYVTFLTVTDTKAPTAEVRTLFLKPGSMPKPEDFLERIFDGSSVTVSYRTEPDAASREFQTIGLRLTDAAGNSTDLDAGLLFTDIQPVTVEARQTPLTIADFSYDHADAALLTSFAPNRLGTFSVHVTVNGEEELAIVKVQDTIPPELSAKNKRLYVNHPVATEQLYERLYDGTAAVVTASDIDWSAEGEQTVTLTATDEAGNKTTRTISLTLMRDTVSPVIYGVQNRTVYAGEPVAYLSEVFALDALDGSCEVKVDASAVDPNTPGSYPVVYTAQDLSRNVASASCMFTFVSATVTEEDLHLAAKEIVEQVTTDDMTTTERLKAIYDYVYERITYNGRSDKTDWRKEAMNGFRLGTGDCFTYYSALRALLDETDIPYMSVTRKGGATRHYWLIVNVGTGWYHLDANHSNRSQWRCFMWTDEQCASPVGFWNYERSIYPEIATTTFDTDAVIAKERAEQAKSKD